MHGADVALAATRPVTAVMRFGVVAFTTCRHGPATMIKFECSGAPRANTASLSERVSAKLGEQELRLEVAAHRRNETTVRVPHRVGMTAGFGRAATMSL